MKKNVLSLVPDEFISKDETGFSEDNVLGLPDWFKNTALWWSQGIITDKEFKKNVEFLVKKGIVPDKTSKAIDAFVNTKQPIIDTIIPIADTDTTVDTTDPIADTTDLTADTTQPAAYTPPPPIEKETMSENAKQVNDLADEINLTVNENEEPTFDSETFLGLEDILETFSSSGNLDQIYADDLIGMVNTSLEQFESENLSDGCETLDNFKFQLYILIQLQHISQLDGESLINYSGTLKQIYC